MRFHLWLTLGCAVLAIAARPILAQQAIDRSGLQHSGKLVEKDGKWQFEREQGKAVQPQELTYIRFASNESVLPGTRLTHTLLLSHGQRLTGSLVRVDEKKVELMTALGKAWTLPREQVVGVVQASDWLPIRLKRQEKEGEPQLDTKVVLFGQPAICIDRVGQRLTYDWQGFHEATRVNLYLRGRPGAFRCTIETINSKPIPQSPALVLDDQGIHCINVSEKFGLLETNMTWRALFIELQGNVLRFYMDEYCLGQTTLPQGNTITGIRVITSQITGKVTERGGVWLSDPFVGKRLPASPLPENSTRQDFLWLPGGEQLFGRVVSADARGIVLDAKFGKRQFDWTQVRGIGFADEKRQRLPSTPAIAFRPGSGFAPDLLRAKLLRWENAKLIVEHDLLGEIAIDRDRLGTIRFEVK